MWASPPILSTGYRTLVSSTGGVNFDHLAKMVYARFLHREITTLPFPFLRIRVIEVQLTSTLLERGIQLHLLEGEVLKNVWIYIHVRTTEAINKYLGELLLRLCNYLAFFPLKFCSLIWTVIGGSCLQQLLLWCSSVLFFFFFNFSHCFNGNSFV